MTVALLTKSSRAKKLLLPVFIWFQPKLVESMVIRGEYMPLLAIWQKTATSTFFLNRGSFHPISPKLHSRIVYHGETQATFLAILVVALWNFNMGVNEKNRKMCNILKTSDRRAKEICDSWCYYVHMQGTFHVWFFDFCLGSSGSLCKIPPMNAKIFNLLTLHSYCPIKIKLYGKHGNQGWVGGGGAGGYKRCVVPPGMYIWAIFTQKAAITQKMTALEKTFKLDLKTMRFS